MPAFILPLLAFLPTLFKWGSKFFTFGGEIVVAAITALPGVLSGLAAFLKEVAQSPLLSVVVFGGIMSGAAFVWGLKMDAPIRAKLQQNAIAGANKRADIAIAAIERQYAKQLADARAKLAAYERKPTKRKR